MNTYEIGGHLVTVLRPVISCDLETFVQAPGYILTDDYSFYAGNMKFPTYANSDKTVKEKELQNSIPKSWTNRFSRLQKITTRYYKYELSYTNDPIPSIVQSVKSENTSRLLIFKSNDLVGDFSELIKIFRLNSFLYQRFAKPRLVDQLYFRAGFISEKKLNRMLLGKGRGVFAETFRLMQIILDKDFANNVDTIRPKLPEPARRAAL
jgi:hypothetical protein